MSRGSTSAGSTATASRSTTIGASTSPPARRISVPTPSTPSAEKCNGGAATCTSISSTTTSNGTSFHPHRLRGHDQDEGYEEQGLAQIDDVDRAGPCPVDAAFHA